PVPAAGYRVPESFLFNRQRGRAPAGALGADPKQGHPTATATGAGSRSVCRALGSWAIGSSPSLGGDNRAKTRCDPNAGSSFCPGGGYRTTISHPWPVEPVVFLRRRPSRRSLETRTWRPCVHPVIKAHEIQ